MATTQDDDQRPDPDALLARVTAESEVGKRATLKIFFGFAPGVGKTFAMLESARRLKAQGVDVVVGLIETHGRPETTALLEGLEVLPRQSLPYRGRALLEFDLEGALRRRPAVLLLDELAHGNVPGTRHTKRWQDVLELLDAGIEVHSTLNVQHVESLNDVVAQITHVQVRETVPDSILERADEIELVDIPPEELLARLKQGKVYLPAQAQRASEHFFTKGNLLALRELALRRTAQRVDDDIVAYRQLHEIERTWPSGERIVVCVGPAPASERLVRAARRMAAGLRAPWFAVCVDNPVVNISQVDRTRLEAHLELAAELGGEVVRLTGPSVATAVLEWARAHNVTRIILGKPTHARLRDRLRGSLLDELVRGSGDIDVFVISGESEADAPRQAAPAPDELRWQSYAGAVASVVAVTLLNLGLDRLFHLPDPEMLYLLAIMLVASAFGRGPALVASAASVASYDFFFVPPFLTFAVRDTRYVLTFAMMFGVASVISTLTSRIRSQERRAQSREQHARSLFALTRALGGAATVEELAGTTARHCAEALHPAQVTVLVPVEDRLEPGGHWPPGAVLAANDIAVAQWVHDHTRAAGRGTDTLSGATVYCVPAGKGDAVIAVRRPDELRFEERSVLDSFAQTASVSFQRFHLAEQARAAAVRARTEELRSSLLSAVSHDLRTPLAVVTGAASTLRSDPGLDADARAQLLDTITDEAERLERLVRNLLDMTRVQAGALKVKREWVPVEELVGSVRARLRAALAGRDVRVWIPHDLPLVSVDPVLFEQVLWNILENAVKYTPPGSPIELTASAVPGAVQLEVADHGPGFPASEAEKLFEKFYRGAHTGTSGAGLGLAVARGIVEAHGGRIEASPREDTPGARFTIIVPVVGTPPPVPVEEGA